MKAEELVNNFENLLDSPAFIDVGIVARNDDPERRGRIQVMIPVISENEIYEVWARRLQLFVGANGFGDFHLPEVGTEVMIMGRLGATHNLFYAPLANETHCNPPDFDSADTRGFRNDADYKAITEGDFVIRAGRIILEADSTVVIKAPGGIFTGSGGAQ